jgi:membrane-associated protein
VEILHHLFNAHYLIGAFGLLGICAIIFAETGLFPLLPGDSLLFVAGICAVTPADNSAPILTLWQLLILVPLCAVVGDQVGYQVGRRAGATAYQWRERRVWGIPVFKAAYLHKTKDFFDRWGIFAVIASRWVPIVRTFAPVLAGVVKMPAKTFVPFNIIGGVTWVWTMVLLGFFTPPLVHQFFPSFDLEANIEKIVLVIILVSVLPIVYTAWKEKQVKGAQKTKITAKKKAVKKGRK